MAETTVPGQHPNPKWGQDKLAPLETRIQLRRERAAGAKADTFNHAEELRDIRRAEREGERGQVNQLATGNPLPSGGTPAEGVTAGAPTAPVATGGDASGEEAAAAAAAAIKAAAEANKGGNPPAGGWGDLAGTPAKGGKKNA